MSDRLEEGRYNLRASKVRNSIENMIDLSEVNKLM